MKFVDDIDDKFPEGLAGYRAGYTLTHPWVCVGYFSRKIKFAFQRAIRGWDDSVIWSIDWYLATNIPVWFRHLKDSKVGVPTCMFEETDFDKSGKEKPGSMEKASKKYDLILDEIILGFESYLKLGNYVHTDPEYQRLNALYERGFDLFREYFGTFWD